eukprot:jgi/Mesen1/5280/ME000263S04390
MQSRLLHVMQTLFSAGGLLRLLVCLLLIAAAMVITERHVRVLSQAGEREAAVSELREALSQLEAVKLAAAACQVASGAAEKRAVALAADLAATNGSLAACQVAAATAVPTPPPAEDNAGGAAELAKLQEEIATLKVRERLRVTCQLATAGGDPALAPSAAGRDSYACSATAEDLAQYLNYTARGDCPNDWYFTQSLIFEKSCFALPKRRCRAPAAARAAEPEPFPASLWSLAALKNENVRWDLHHCKSYECINTRKLGDCRNCFNLTLEAMRWVIPKRGTIEIEEVVRMKKGGLRIGLDAGGGTGSFAAKMAAFNVTIITTAMDTETLWDVRAGLPYMETIALRGLLPLHLPHKARLPFFDGTLDLVHTVNSIKYFTLLDFEELLFDWDRVLRPGGIIWFELFYASVGEMPLYVAVLDLLGYERLYWNFAPKTDAGEREGVNVYLNCVLEKPHPSH